MSEEYSYDMDLDTTVDLIMMAKTSKKSRKVIYNTVRAYGKMILDKCEKCKDMKRLYYRIYRFGLKTINVPSSAVSPFDITLENYIQCNINPFYNADFDHEDYCQDDEQLESVPTKAELDQELDDYRAQDPRPRNRKYKRTLRRLFKLQYGQSARDVIKEYEKKLLINSRSRKRGRFRHQVIFKYQTRFVKSSFITVDIVKISQACLAYGISFYYKE